MTRFLHSLTERLLEPRLDVTRLTVRVPDLAPALDGFSIAQISDLHYGEGAWRPFHLDDVAQILRAEQPDVVINSGDFILGEPDLSVLLRGVSSLVLPPPEPEYGPRNIAVLGNHDYFPGLESACILKDGLRSIGITIIDNEGVCVSRGGAGVSIVGLSAGEGHDHFARGVEVLLAAGRPRIAVVHAPDRADLLPPGSADLILSGHTHGGQIVLPGLRKRTVHYFADSNYVQGLYRINGMPLYVNRGLGYSGWPIRFRAAPEVAFFHLVP